MDKSYFKENLFQGLKDDIKELKDDTTEMKKDIRELLKFKNQTLAIVAASFVFCSLIGFVTGVFLEIAVYVKK